MHFKRKHKLPKHKCHICMSKKLAHGKHPLKYKKMMDETETLEPRNIEGDEELPDDEMPSDEEEILG